MITIKTVGTGPPSRSLSAVPFVMAIIFLMLSLSGTAARADFPVSTLTGEEKWPVVAANTQTGDFLVAYVREETAGYETVFSLVVKRFNSAGVQQGGLIRPFGDPGSHMAISRPAIAYSPNANIFLVTVVERLDTRDRVLARFLGSDGTPLPTPEYLFATDYYRYYDRDESGTLKVTHNSLRDEFLVTVQRTSIYEGTQGVWGQRISTSGVLSSPVLMGDFGVSGVSSQVVAYAPVPGTTPSGGRYIFFPTGNDDPYLLDSDLNRIVVFYKPDGTPFGYTIPLQWGEPDGNYYLHDVAYGVVEGKRCFLVVYSDKDNRYAGDPDWGGIWGTYVDPDNVHYDEDFKNTPFPLVKIDSHTDDILHENRARVAYNQQAEAFFCGMAREK